MLNPQVKTALFNTAPMQTLSPSDLNRAAGASGQTGGWQIIAVPTPVPLDVRWRPLPPLV